MGKAWKRAGVAALVAASTAVLAEPALAQQSKAPANLRGGQQCFRASDWNGWKATPDGKTVYISAGFKRFYKFDMAQPCQELNDPQAVMVTRTDTSWICRPLDVNMTIMRPGIGVTWCQVRKISRLTAEEGKALPRNLRP